MKDEELLARIESELETRNLVQEVESRDEFAIISPPKAPVNPYPNPVCPALYW